MRSHPEYPRLVLALSRIAPRLWAGVAYRSVSPEYARSRDLLSGEGTRRHGGRWSLPGRFETVSASLSPETAVAEALARFRYYGIPEADAMPRLLVAIDVEVAALVDLTTGPSRRILRVSRRRMRREPWRRAEEHGREALTQAIGRAAFDTGLEGLLVPSAADRVGENLVLFPGRLRLGSRLRARPAGLRLPPR
jgi:RES domain-containing protein